MIRGGLKKLASPKSPAAYLLLPAICLPIMAVILFPHLWPALHHSYQVCQVYVDRLTTGGVLLKLVFAVLVISGLTGLAAMVWQVLRLRSLSRSLSLSNQVLFPILDDPRVLLVEESHPYAFCHGLLRPRVYISRGLVRLLAPDEMRAVLLHELTHLKGRDPLRVLAGRVLAAALFVLPAARLVYGRYLLRLEQRADRAAIRAVGAGPLAGAMVKLAQTPAGIHAGAAASGLLPAGARIEWLLKGAEGPPVSLVPKNAFFGTGALVFGVAASVALVGTLSTRLAAWASLCPASI